MVKESIVNMTKTKVSPVIISIEQPQLKEVYNDLMDCLNMKVKYDQDQLQMANECIFEMRRKLVRCVNFLYNKGAHYNG